MEANCRGQASRNGVVFQHEVAQKSMFEGTLGVILWKPIVGARPLRTMPHVECKVAQITMFAVTLGAILWKPIVGTRPLGTVLILSTKPHKKKRLKSL